MKVVEIIKYNAKLYGWGWVVFAISWGVFIKLPCAALGWVFDHLADACEKVVDADFPKKPKRKVSK